VNRAWREQGERGTPFTLKLILRIALHMGRRPARVLLYPITLYFLLTARAQRRASRRYLARVLGRPAGWRDVARHIFCFASTILDRVFLLTERTELFDVRQYGTALVSERVAQGQGCLLVGSHLGSFEVLRSLAVAEHHFPLRILMYRDHNQTITRLLEDLNPEIAETVIPLGGPETLLRVHAEVSDGKLVGMLGDRVADSDKVVRCHFLGRETAFPAGPMLLAATLKVPVVLFFGLYRGGNRYDVHIELFAERVTLDRADQQADLQRWTQRYADRLEHYVRMAPYNWFNFYDFWDEED
jgi:predicted LPLAT superfamily acyltransferase